MILFFGMQLLPVGYEILYLRHSIQKRRKGQAIATGVLLTLDLLISALFLWEYLAMP